MANRWIKRIKNAQDNFFDKQITYENYDEVTDFDREFIRAKNVTSISGELCNCLLYTSPSPRDRQKSRMPSSA